MIDSCAVERRCQCRVKVAGVDGMAVVHDEHRTRRESGEETLEERQRESVKVTARGVAWKGTRGATRAHRGREAVKENRGIVVELIHSVPDRRASRLV